MQINVPAMLGAVIVIQKNPKFHVFFALLLVFLPSAVAASLNRTLPILFFHPTRKLHMTF